MAALNNNNNKNEDDPFAVFANDDDDDDDDDYNDATRIRRDDTVNGPMSHHQGIEQAMLQYVKNSMHKYLGTTTTTNGDKASAVIQCVDEFCYQRHWMMHVGPEKGALLEDFLQSCLQKYKTTQQQSASKSTNQEEPFVLLEMGTYCGYSAIRLCQIMQNVLGTSNDDESHNNDFYLWSVDVNAEYQAIARQLVQLAGWENHVHFLLLQQDTSSLGQVVHEALRQHPKLAQAPVRFVFMDHEKDAYLADLQTLERAQIVQAGCFVAADNVVVFNIDDYRQYVQQLAAAGIVETELRMGHLEYVDLTTQQGQHFKDGLECTIYRKHPPLI